MLQFGEFLVLRRGILFGLSVQVRGDVDEETYERLHEEYCRAVEHGYPDGLFTFAHNHCSTSSYVTVDGEPVDPDVTEE